MFQDILTETILVAPQLVVFDRRQSVLLVIPNVAPIPVRTSLEQHGASRKALIPVNRLPIAGLFRMIILLYRIFLVAWTILV